MHKPLLNIGFRFQPGLIRPGLSVTGQMQQGFHRMVVKEANMQWEYMSIDVGNWEFERLHAALAEFKHQGWELAGAAGAGHAALRPGSGALWLRLKRQQALA